MRVNGEIIKCMERELSLRQMEGSMSENMLTIRSKGTESSFGQMVVVTRAPGKVENSTEKVCM
jgi:hypothetical protein